MILELKMGPKMSENIKSLDYTTYIPFSIKYG